MPLLIPFYPTKMFADFPAVLSNLWLTYHHHTPPFTLKIVAPAVRLELTKPTLSLKLDGCQLHHTDF